MYRKSQPAGEMYLLRTSTVNVQQAFDVLMEWSENPAC